MRCSTDKLSELKQLYGGVYFMDSLPTTPSGKLLKRIVKERVIQIYQSRQNSMSE